MSKPPILFLCHRIPFPPNKGDKIRSFNILRWLAERYAVHLACFIDDPEDSLYAKELDKYCSSVCCIKLNPLVAKIRGITGIFTGDPLTLPYYFNSKLQGWVDSTISNFGIKQALVFSSSMAQYLEGDRYKSINRVVDFVDVDSDKWRQYAKKQSFPMSWIYQREFKTLALYEVNITNKFDAACFVTQDEVALFKKNLPLSIVDKIHAVENGVNSDFFSPEANFSPNDVAAVEGNPPYVCFTGAMDYWANEDAVIWFANEVWPLVTSKKNGALFYIVGGNPPAKIRELAERPGIVVTGRVEDVRPYIFYSHAVVAPLRIARGVQNKVLEALAMARPVIATTMAMEGIKNIDNLNVTVIDGVDETAKKVIEIISAESLIADENRGYALKHYAWPAKLSALSSLLKES